jgi:hypothetical protein
MSPKQGDLFGNFSQRIEFKPAAIKPITTEFSRGAVPNSIVAMDRESAWTRWRRGYELAVTVGIQKGLTFPFRYTMPTPPGTEAHSGNKPLIVGVVQGFPTSNREFGIHWTGCRVGALLRFDNVFDSTGTRASVASVTEDADNWYVQLAGTWNGSNPLPAPLYVPPVGSNGALKPLNGEIIEDRLLEPGGTPLTGDTLNPSTNKRYGYVQALLLDVNGTSGVLTLKKAGSFESTPDGVLITPASRPPAIDRFLTLGTRYACTCQDFSRRSYAYFRDMLGSSTKRFPYTKPSSLKYGRHELITDADGNINNNADTDISVNRRLELTFESVDNPGLFRDFGGRYLRNVPSAGAAEGPGTFVDYKAVNNQIVSFDDYWTPLLDEMRYCKHIYALRFQEGIILPEPSDVPIDMDEGMVRWEQKLVNESSVMKKHAEYIDSINGLKYMDLPPSNFQSPQLLPMMQKLLNVPTSFIKRANFEIQRKDGAFTSG